MCVRDTCSRNIFKRVVDQALKRHVHETLWVACFSEIFKDRPLETCSSNMLKRDGRDTCSRNLGKRCVEEGVPEMYRRDSL